MICALNIIISYSEDEIKSFCKKNCHFEPKVSRKRRKRGKSMQKADRDSRSAAFFAERTVTEHVLRVSPRSAYGFIDLQNF